MKTWVKNLQSKLEGDPTVNKLGIVVLQEMMQSYPARALDRRLQEDWARDSREGPRILMSLRVDFGPMG